MKKHLLYNIGVVLFYLLALNIFRDKKVVFPLFMISLFLFSIFSKVKEVRFSFILMWLIFIGHLFFESTIISTVIIYIIFLPLTFWLALYLKNKSWVSKIGYSALLVLVGIYGFTNLFFFITTFNAHNVKDAPKIELFLSDNSQVRIDTIHNKVIVLDFWTTSCGLCYQKFAAYEELYLKYKDNPKVELYTVNIPIKRDTIGYAKLRIESYDYSFPNLYADSDTLPKSFGFNKYPHLIIVKNGKTRFNGLLILDKELFVNNLEDEIELLLKED